MDEKQSETRERYLAGWQARMNPHEADDNRREIRERHLGIGVAMGSGVGVAIGAGFGVAFGDVGLGIGVGIALGVALGLILGNKQAKAVQGPSDTDGSRNA